MFLMRLAIPLNLEGELTSERIRVSKIFCRPSDCTLFLLSVYHTQKTTAFLKKYYATDVLDFLSFLTA